MEASGKRAMHVIFSALTELYLCGFAYTQGRNEGWQGRYDSPGAESLWERRKVPKLSQVLSSIHYIYFRNISGSNMGWTNLLLVPGAI